MTDLLDVKENLDQMLQYLNSTDVEIIGKELKQNIVNALKIVKKLTLTDVIVSDFCECDGVQDLHAMTGECRKCGKECDY